MIPIFSNRLEAEELSSVERVFKSGWTGMGKEVSAFEEEFGLYQGNDNVLCVDCCTIGLKLALIALGCCGKQVIIPSIHFAGAIQSITEAGATPVIVDVDPITLSISPEEVKRVRSKDTAAIMTLHYGGRPVDAEVFEAAEGLKIISDEANSVASRYFHSSSGSLADVGVYSFDSMKQLVAVEGGAMVFKDRDIYEKVRRLRYMGLRPGQTSGTDAAKAGASRWWEYELDCVSGRHIWNDVFAAIGRSQLTKLKDLIAHNKKLWNAYQYYLRPVSGIQTPPNPDIGTSSSYYLYWIFAEKRDKLATYLKDNDVYTTFRYYPLHKLSMYSRFAAGELPNSDMASEKCLCLPLNCNITVDNVQHICELVRGFHD